MIGSSTFVEIFGSVPPGDPERVAQVARAAGNAGLAVVLCRPGEKVPLCPLTARDRKAQDKLAQDAARDRGERAPERRRHPCGLAHATTDGPWLYRAVQRLSKGGATPNLGVELGKSRMIVVDVDSAAELKAFLDMREEREGHAPRTLTVRSPGKLGRDGQTWAHRDGGHFWFVLPDGVQLPKGLGTYRVPSAENGAPGGWVVSWADHQVLVPPSVRAEGPYELLSEPEPVPPWLLKLVSDVAAARDQRTKDRATMLIDSDDPIEVWSISTSWAELLEPDGWTDSGQIDTCSCPIWTAPGDHAHWKSATAHELGCAVFDVSTGWGPLRIWTDTPQLDGIEGARTYTKLQYVAARDHGEDQRAAMVDLGLAQPGMTADVGFNPDDNPDLSLNGISSGGLPEVKDPWDGDDSVPFDAAGQEAAPPDPVDVFIGHMLSSTGLDSIPDPEPLIDGALFLDSTARMVGKPGHGKSFAAIDMACSVALGVDWQGRPVRQGLAVYLVAEGARGFKKRIRAWERRHNDGDPLPPDRFMVIPFPVQAAIKKDWDLMRAALRRLDPSFVVLDTQARISVGADENSAQEMGVFVERIEQVRRDTGACVLLVHHLGHQGEHGRGSSAMVGALTTELRVTKDDHKVKIYCDKQKDEEAFDVIELTLTPDGDSAVLVGVETADPFTAAETVTPESPMPEYMAWVLWAHFPATGATAAQLASVIREHRKLSKTQLYDVLNTLLKRKTVCAVAGANGGKTKTYVTDEDYALDQGWKRRPGTG